VPPAAHYWGTGATRSLEGQDITLTVLHALCSAWQNATHHDTVSSHVRVGNIKGQGASLHDGVFYVDTHWRWVGI
jgi:hypothetical protein